MLILEAITQLAEAAQQASEIMTERARIKAQFETEWNAVSDKINSFETALSPMVVELNADIAEYGYQEQSAVQEPLNRLPKQEDSKQKLQKAKLLFEAPEQRFEDAWKILVEVSNAYDLTSVIDEARLKFKDVLDMEESCRVDIVAIENRLDDLDDKYENFVPVKDKRRVRQVIYEVKSLLGEEDI